MKMNTMMNTLIHLFAGVFRANHCADDSSQLAEAALSHHLGHLHRHLLEDRGPLSYPQPEAWRLVRGNLHQSCWYALK